MPNEYLLISQFWRNQDAILSPLGIRVAFDEDGISSPVDKTTAETCHQQFGLMIFSTPETIPGEVSGIEDVDTPKSEPESLPARKAKR